MLRSPRLGGVGVVLVVVLVVACTREDEEEVPGRLRLVVLEMAVETGLVGR